MQEAILFTIFFIGFYGGLIAIHVAGKIIGLFISKYEKVKRQKKKLEAERRETRLYVDKLEAENHELRRRVSFYENEHLATASNN